MRTLSREGNELVFTDDDGTVISLESTDWDRAAQMIAWFIHYREAFEGQVVCPFCMFVLLPWEELAENKLAHEVCRQDAALEAYEAAELERWGSEVDIQLPSME